jgi:hypothetical protein
MENLLLSFLESQDEQQVKKQVLSLHAESPLKHLFSLLDFFSSTRRIDFNRVRPAEMDSKRMCW